MDWLNWFAIVVVTVANFILGAVWFSAFFGKQWWRIHHGDEKMTEAKMKEMSKGMGTLMVTEFVATGLMIVGLACLIGAIPEYSGIKIAFMVWLAFVLPMVISSVIWGNDRREMRLQKIALSASYRLIALLGAGYILAMW
jgi:fatty acid desaturase